MAAFAPRFIAAFSLCVMVSIAGEASAQTDQARATARSTATEGLRAMEEGRYADAASLFQRAEELVHAPPHLLYFARASVKLGKLVQANEAYVKILRETLPPNAPKAFVEAQQAAATEQPKVEASLPHLSIQVEGEKASEAHVTINGNEIPQAAIGISAPRDPGELEIQATAPGVRSEKAKLSLKEGAHETVKLVLNIKDETAVATAPEHVETVAGPKTGLRIAGWVTLILGAGGLGMGTYFLVDNRNNREAANALCNLPNNVCPSSQRATIQSYDSTANTDAILSWISYGVGAAAVVGGVIMIVASRGKSEPSPKAAVIQPWVGFGSLGLSGTF